jgi:zinc and cadmium transporter
VGETAASLLAVAGISLVSGVGGAALLLRPLLLRRWLLLLVAFAAGTLLGEVFLHLLPEIAEAPGGIDVPSSLLILGGIVAFFVLEKGMHWHHAHLPDEEVLHPLVLTNLVGDALHNLIDGAIVAAAFLSSPELGLSTAIAVAVHEVPQELGDFAILVHGGLSPRHALLLNLGSAVLAFIGAGIVLALGEGGLSVERFLLPLTAGGFVYLAGTDLLPELHREPKLASSARQLVGILAGIGVMTCLLLFD